LVVGGWGGAGHEGEAAQDEDGLEIHFLVKI
jgi:hypothetical protein